MEGLDYFVVEGGRTFDDLLWVVTQLRLCKAEMDQMIKDLSECKQYLKHDFKIHLEEKTDIKNHCMTFSLNDKDLHFKNECCDHQHLSGCPKCLQLSDLLDEIRRRVQLLETENIEDLYDEILFKTSNAIDNIAIDSRNNTNYKCKIVEIDGNVLKPSVKAIPSISSFSNFNYSQHGFESIWDWKRKLMKWNQIYDCTKKMSACLKLTDFSKNITFTDIKVKYSEARQGLRESNNEEEHCSEEEEDDQNLEAAGDEENNPNEGGMLCCPVDGCVKSFIKHKNLDDHLLIGNFTSKVEKTYSLSSDTVVAKENISEGWALKTRKPPTLFSKEQKMYLDEKFNIGETTGKKEDPISVAQEMRTTKVKGKRRFKMNEFLTSQQIANYFSRVSRKKVEDNMLATIEQHLSSVREEILTKVND
ncbi:unnamed protein product [Mytilus coruscus]|uniref:C2H2-type domain-containing protein n=1 Tax=Mytilus coruscus TaxID=42192 RepID=A0A6J8D7V6_MYTCO|nr:unnamed protein product [Mytilus coruscus]